jgi:hypothetical protein
MTFDHPNIKNASITSSLQPDGSMAPHLILVIDIDERGPSQEAREIEAIAQDWLRRNPTGSVTFDRPRNLGKE